MGGKQMKWCYLWPDQSIADSQVEDWDDSGAVCLTSSWCTWRSWPTLQVQRSLQEAKNTISAELCSFTSHLIYWHIRWWTCLNFLDLTPRVNNCWYFSDPKFYSFVSKKKGHSQVWEIITGRPLLIPQWEIGKMKHFSISLLQQNVSLIWWRHKTKSNK